MTRTTGRPVTIAGLPADWWGVLAPGAPASPRRSIVELIRDRVLDERLAALCWLLLEGRLPIVVAGLERHVGKTTLLSALLEFLPPDARVVPLEGAWEEFEWLPEAPELGWRPNRPRTPDAVIAAAAARFGGRPIGYSGADQHRHIPVSPDSTVLLVAELSDHLPAYTWGPHARIAVRALALGYGMAATIHADKLEDVFDQLAAPPVRLASDELSRLGVVIILRFVADPRGSRERVRRVAAAHYVRPVVRDMHGHVQRLAPAVLAAYDKQHDELEHYGWGLTAELGGRVGRSGRDFDAEHTRRADYLGGLVAAGITNPDDVRAAIAGYRGMTAVSLRVD